MRIAWCACALALAGCASLETSGAARAFDSGLLRCDGLSYTLSPEEGLRVRAHFYNFETRGVCIYHVTYGFADVTEGAWRLLGEPDLPLDVSPGGLCLPEMSDRIRELHIADTARLAELATMPEHADALFGIVLVTVERDGKTFVRVRDLAIPAGEVRGMIGVE